MAEYFDTHNKPSNQEEKRVYSALLVVAVAALILGFWQLRNNIKLPFIINAPTNTDLVDNADQSVLALKNKDTDGDGLTDYDEVYVYNTSAFLADTDSDGYRDNEEITSGNNPLCPAKQTCLVAAPTFAAAEVAPQTTSELRTLLLQAGISPDQLSAIDDNTLLQLYSDVAKANTPTTSQPADSTTSATTDVQDITITDAERQALSQLSGTELREYLRQSGIDTTTLDSIDDATLKLLVNQALGL